MTQSLLLDTHTFAWAVRTPELLTEKARTAILDDDMSILVSAASVWEMAIKFGRGRWPEVEAIVHDLQRALAGLGAWLWPLNGTHGVRAGLLSWSHKDPFDRMLAAVALTDTLTLVTRDRAFRDVPGLSVLW
jgi:PIN domain nuclease of toxin-antitoxin system